jgi:virginiamycin B lyase
MKTKMTTKITMNHAQPLATCAFTLALFAQTAPAYAQYTAKDWPDGAMKQRFTDTCGACHDINRVRVGYTPEGWLTSCA